MSAQATSQSHTLPPLRKKILRHSFVLVALSILLGTFMMVAVFLASGITPRLIHLNYDSIAASREMHQAWNALRFPEVYPEKSKADWAKQFDQAITFEFGNITEPGEADTAKKIRELWEKTGKDPSHVSSEDFLAMRRELDRLVQINEQGMFSLAAESVSFSRHVLIASLLIFLVVLVLSIYLADGLAVKISSPLKELAETLRKKPALGSKLRLPDPTSLEVRILEHELMILWERLSTLRKLNLDELASQKRWLEAVVTSVDDAILVLDRSEKVIHCNEGLLRLLELGEPQVIGHSWIDLPTASENYFKLRSLFVPAIPIDNAIELVYQGRKRIFSGRCRTVGEIGTLYLLHDITEQRQRDRLKSEFMGVLSHELKTPLQSLGTATELLLSSRTTQAGAEEKMLLDTIHEDVARIRAVANEFVQVGSVDLQSLRLKLEPATLGEKLKDWIKPFQVIGKERSVRIELIEEGSPQIWAKIDVVKFPWAVANLISNAMRVSPNNGVVQVQLSDRRGFADIEIRDEGPGVPEELRSRIFEPYFQGYDPKSTRLAGFLGLGLTITKEVVEAHDGEIEYFPRQSGGSTFRISLPLVLTIAGGKA
jgi:NtrC-family two-component system sensor histidine kinase KinB